MISLVIKRSLVTLQQAILSPLYQRKIIRDRSFSRFIFQEIFLSSYLATFAYITHVNERPVGIATIYYLMSFVI